MSIKGNGSYQPDSSKNVVLSNGAIVPLGKMVSYQDQNGRSPNLSYTEYIVPNES